MLQIMWECTLQEHDQALNQALVPHMQVSSLALFDCATSDNSLLMHLLKSGRCICEAAGLLLALTTLLTTKETD